MHKNKKIGIVIPAHNEEKLIGRVIETMPDYVDKIVIVNDASTDKTKEMVEKYKPTLGDKLLLINHKENQGVGGAIATGYKWMRDNEIDVVAVMAGDGQMTSEDLPMLLDPVVSGGADCTKGNRLFTGSAWKIIPKLRYIGNSILSLLTKIASGYWHIADSQTGYVVVSLKVLKTLNLDAIYKRYGMPNDFLVRLNVYNFKVKDIPVKPVYGIGEKSGIRMWKVIFSISFLLIRLFLWRMKEKYVIRDFHPLVFFYAFSLILFIVEIPLTFRLLYFWLKDGFIPPTNLIILIFVTIAGLQSLFFAMWFDMECNKDLK